MLKVIKLKDETEHPYMIEVYFEPFSFDIKNAKLSTERHIEMNQKLNSQLALMDKKDQDEIINYITKTLQSYLHEYHCFLGLIGFTREFSPEEVKERMRMLDNPDTYFSGLNEVISSLKGQVFFRNLKNILSIKNIKAFDTMSNLYGKHKNLVPVVMIMPSKFDESHYDTSTIKIPIVTTIEEFLKRDDDNELYGTSFDNEYASYELIFGVANLGVHDGTMYSCPFFGGMQEDYEFVNEAYVLKEKPHYKFHKKEAVRIEFKHSKVCAYKPAYLLEFSTQFLPVYSMHMDYDENYTSLYYCVTKSKQLIEVVGHQLDTFFDKEIEEEERVKYLKEKNIEGSVSRAGLYFGDSFGGRKVDTSTIEVSETDDDEDVSIDLRFLELKN